MSGTISLLGTSAVLFEAPGACLLASQQRIWALARSAEAWPEIREAVPGMNNLMLVFDTPPRDLPAFERGSTTLGALPRPCRSRAASSNYRSLVAERPGRICRMC